MSFKTKTILIGSLTFVIGFALGFATLWALLFGLFRSLAP